LRPVALLAVIALALGAAPALAQSSDVPTRDDGGQSVELAPVQHASPAPISPPVAHLESPHPTRWFWGWVIAGAGAAASIAVGAGAASCSSSTCSRNLLGLLTTLIVGELVGGGYAVVAALRDPKASPR
jgi:hypothetical protein